MVDFSGKKKKSALHALDPAFNHQQYQAKKKSDKNNNHLNNKFNRF